MMTMMHVSAPVPAEALGEYNLLEDKSLPNYTPIH